MTANSSGQVEVDRGTGSVTVGATTIEARDALLKAVNELIYENQVVRVKADPKLIKAQYRELSRSKPRHEIVELAWMDCDEKSGDIVLRGTPEKLEKAKPAYIKVSLFCILPTMLFICLCMVRGWICWECDSMLHILVNKVFHCTKSHCKHVNK